MKKFLALIFFIFCLYTAKSREGAAEPDTTLLQLIRPAAEKEKEIFADPKLIYPKSIVAETNILEKFLNWLSGLLFGNPGYENVALTRKLIIWSLILIFILVLIRFLKRSDMISLVRPQSKSMGFHFSDISENINEIDFESRILQAAASNNFREAIRWSYLQVLSLLDRKEHITFSPYKTNVDYMQELKDKTIRQTFRDLSIIYEYVWYGKFETSAADYDKQKQMFHHFKTQLSA